MPFYPNELFGTFGKRFEDIMKIAEAAGYACTPEQIAAKAFNLIVKSQAYPEGCRKWKRKANADKIWANPKDNFTIKAKECYENLHTWLRMHAKQQMR